MSKFILKVTNQKGLQQSDFKTNQECIDHFEKYRAVGYWGKESYTYTVPEEKIVHPEEIISPAVVGVPATPDIFNDNGELITPGTPEIPPVKAVVKPEWEEVIPAHDVFVPAEYTYEILDKSAEESVVEAKKVDRIDRIDKLFQV